jgi:hypothetical protein
MSKGDRRVGLKFNPLGLDEVSQIKGVTATIIDNLEDFQTTDPEIKRWVALAQTKYEEACMFAVKALTATEEEVPDSEEERN